MDGQSQAVGMAGSTGAGPSGNWGGVGYVMPVVTVPYVNTIGQVNVNWPPSQDAYGKDLPLSADVNTLRYFFNLGVEYFGISAHIQQQRQQQQQQQQQQYPQYSYPTTPPQLSYAYQNGPVESSMQVPNDLKAPTIITGYHSPHASSSSTPQTPKGKPSPSLPSIQQMQTFNCNSSTSSSGQEKETKDTMDLVSDVSDSGFTSSGEGDGEQGREDDLDASIPQEPKLPEHDPGSGQGEDGVKVVKEKGKRKYYMYGTHKLIKPIKDIPPRFQQLLTEMKANKERCHGQPVYMVEPLAEQGPLDQDSGGRLNAEAQCFYPRRQYNVCVTGNPSLYMNTSETSSIHPPPMVPHPAVLSFGNHIPPPMSVANSGELCSVVAQVSSMASCMASSLPPPPPPPVYAHGPPALDGKTPSLTSPVKSVPGAEADRRPGACVPCPPSKAENARAASTLHGPSLGAGSSHTFHAMSASLPSVPPPKILSTPGGSSVSSGMAENPRVNYHEYQTQSTVSTLGFQAASHAPTLPQGQLTYVVSTPTFGPPPSCLTYPPPVMGPPAHSTSVPCPPVAVQ